MFSKAGSLYEKRRHNLSGGTAAAIPTMNSLWKVLDLANVRDVPSAGEYPGRANIEEIVNDNDVISDAADFLTSDEESY